MVDAPAYAPGTPIWVDLASPDLEASRTFYGQLFGWEALPGPPEAGGYTMFTLGGKLVAGLGPTFSPEQPPAWSTYISTADADATADAVRQAGGQVIMEPMDVLDAGRMATFIDPTGAYVGVWQPDRHRGAEVVNEPGSFCWNELNTRNVEAAKPFYSRVFGWESDTNPMPNGESYTEWKIDGKSIAGGFQMTEQIPDYVPPHWLTYFTVPDCGAAVARIQELGGSVAVPPTDIGFGHFAVAADPQGAVFAVMAFKQ